MLESGHTKKWVVRNTFQNGLRKKVLKLYAKGISVWHCNSFRVQVCALHVNPGIPFQSPCLLNVGYLVAAGRVDIIHNWILAFLLTGTTFLCFLQKTGQKLWIKTWKTGQNTIKTIAKTGQYDVWCIWRWSLVFRKDSIAVKEWLETSNKAL